MAWLVPAIHVFLLSSLKFRTKRTPFFERLCPDNDRIKALPSKRSKL
jgi:hypothetical protein